MNVGSAPLSRTLIPDERERTPSRPVIPDERARAREDPGSSAGVVAVARGPGDDPGSRLAVAALPWPG